MPTPIERVGPLAGRTSRCLLMATTMLAPLGCGGPSVQEYQNRRELEALLTAVSLRNAAELEKDAQRIDSRRASGELSGDRHRDLLAIIERARAGDWSEAERRAYELRERHPFFR